MHQCIHTETSDVPTSYPEMSECYIETSISKDGNIFMLLQLEATDPIRSESVEYVIKLNSNF
jgi:hypothetical protein